jgi:hypothetical protein
MENEYEYEYEYNLSNRLVVTDAETQHFRKILGFQGAAANI